MVSAWWDTSAQTSWNMLLVRSPPLLCCGFALLMKCPGILADNENDEVHFHVTDTHGLMSSSILSFAEAQEQTLATADPFNFAPYMDQVCPFYILLFANNNFSILKRPL